MSPAACAKTKSGHKSSHHNSYNSFTPNPPPLLRLYRAAFPSSVLMEEPFATLAAALEADISGLKRKALYWHLSGVVYRDLPLDLTNVVDDGKTYLFMSVTTSLSSIVFRPACLA